MHHKIYNKILNLAKKIKYMNIQQIKVLKEHEWLRVDGEIT